MSLCRGRRKDAHKSAFVKSSALRWIRGDLRFNDSLPRPDYIQRLVEHVRQSSSPESMRRVVFSRNVIPDEYVSASFHLPGAYVEFFPCPHCTYTDEEEEGSFVEMFHFANVHNPNVCTTVTFTMPAVMREYNHECFVEVKLTKGCPNAPHVAAHSPLIALHIHTDVFIEVLRFLTRSELDNMRLVSRRWSNVIGRAEGTLQQRRSLCMMMIQFYGESYGMLSAHFLRKDSNDQWRNLRVLTTRGLSQALNAVCSHLRNAFVKVAVTLFVDKVPPPGAPRDVLVDIPLPRRVNFLTSLLHSMPHNSVIDSWSVGDSSIGLGSLPTLARCALTPHRKLGCVRKLGLGLLDRDATWAQFADLFNQPSVRGFNEISISTTMTINTSELRDILSSRQSPKLHLIVLSEIEPPEALLTLPAHLIRDFLALRNVSSFVAEFSLRIAKPYNAVCTKMPDVSDATGRRKRFRYRLQGVSTVVRVNVYANRAARECLTVVTFDHFRTVRFFKGNVSLADLKLTLRRTYNYC
ncbi:hypothetical protein AAVH_26025 [Aphelenchoides avenae]|nr:hypothetical protein AAVH_26025 [Aphelenchus avenae]